MAPFFLSFFSFRCAIAADFSLNNKPNRSRQNVRKKENLIHLVMADTDWSETSLEGLKYRDLQRLAKEAGVKANLPKAQIVQKLVQMRNKLKTKSRSSFATPTIALVSKKTDPLRAKLATPGSVGKAKARRMASAVKLTPAKLARLTPNRKTTTPLKVGTPAKGATPKSNTPVKVATPAKTATPKAAATPAKTITPKTATPAKFAKSPRASTGKMQIPATKATPSKTVLAATKTTPAKTITPAKVSSAMKAMSASKVKTPVTVKRTPFKASAMKSMRKASPAPTGIPRFVSKKAPNFAKLHEQEFNKMESIDITHSKRKERATQSRASMVKEKFEKAKEMAGRHQEVMDKLSKRVTPMDGARKPMRRSPRNAENNPPAAAAAAAFVPSNLVVGEFNFGGVARKSTGVGKPFVFTASPAKVLGNTTNASENTFNLKASLAKPLAYKPHTGKLKDWSETQKNKRQGMSMKTGPTATNKQKQVIKGVRMNKRAEMLMLKRRQN
jgi:hypothetical protein